MNFKLRINHLLLFVCASLLLASCSSDDTPDGGNEGEIAEERSIEGKTVLDNLVVDAGTKKAGAPDTPNEAISFTLNKENTSALMLEGFDVKFNSANTVSGIYLQIKDTDGTIADGYYDIPVTQSILKNSEINLNKKRGLLKTQKNAVNNKVADDDTSIDVDFTSTIEPGTFCYVVCVYDDEGNISAPQEVCVTVESWGGNNELEGAWNYIKAEETYNGETETTNVGVESCDDYQLTCVDQQIIQYSNCYSTDLFTILLNTDGTYMFEVNNTESSINSEATYDSCQEVLYTYDDVSKSTGNWAYNQSNGNLILVEFEYTDTENGVVTETETYDDGDAYVFELAAAVSGNNLTLTEEFVDSDGTVEVYKYFFNK